MFAQQQWTNILCVDFFFCFFSMFDLLETVCVTTLTNKNINSKKKNCVCRKSICVCVCDDTLTDYLEIHSQRRALVLCLQSVFPDIYKYMKKKIWIVDSISSWRIPIPFQISAFSIFPCVRRIFFLSNEFACKLLFDLFPINWCSGI